MFKALVNLLSKAVCLILSKQSFKVSNLCFFKSSLNFLKTFLLFSDLILSKTYFLPNFIFNNLLKPLCIFNLLFNSFSLLHFSKISLQNSWIILALSLIAICLVLLSHLVKYIYNLLFDVLCFWIIILINNLLIFSNLFLLPLAIELKNALCIVDAPLFSFFFIVSIVFFHLYKNLSSIW